MPGSINSNDEIRAQQARTVRGLGENGAPNSAQIGTQNSTQTHAPSIGAFGDSAGGSSFSSIVSSMFGHAGVAGAGGGAGGVVGGRAMFRVVEGGRLQSAFSVNGRNIDAQARSGGSVGVGSADMGKTQTATSHHGSHVDKNAQKPTSKNGSGSGSGSDEKLVDGSGNGASQRSAEDSEAAKSGRAPDSASADVAAGWSNSDVFASSAGLPRADELSPETVEQFNALLLSGDRGVRPMVVTEHASSERLGQTEHEPTASTARPASGKTNGVVMNPAYATNGVADQHASGGKKERGETANVRPHLPAALWQRANAAGRQPNPSSIIDTQRAIPLTVRAGESSEHLQVGAGSVSQTVYDTATRSGDRGGTRSDFTASNGHVSENTTGGRSGLNRDAAHGVWKVETVEPADRIDADRRPANTSSLARGGAGGTEQIVRPSVISSDGQSATRQSAIEAGNNNGQQPESSSVERIASPASNGRQHQPNDGSGNDKPADNQRDLDDRRDTADPSAAAARHVGDAGTPDASPRMQGFGDVGPLADATSGSLGREDVEESERLARQAMAAQVSRGMSALLRGGSGGQATIALAPALLGHLKVTLKIEDGTISASFKPTTEQARGLLHSSLDALRSSLEASGLRVDRLEVGPVQERGMGAGATEIASAERHRTDRVSSERATGVERRSDGTSAEPADNTSRLRSRESAEVRLRLDATA